MNKQHPSILSKGQTVDGQYEVTFFLKKGSYAESYRVKDKDGKTSFMKLFSYAKLHRSQFDEKGEILEIEMLKQISHPNAVTFRESNDVLIDNQKYAYLILDFISGETLADKMRRSKTINPYEAKEIVLGILNGLNYLHGLDNPIIHNDITNLNIMMDLSGKTPFPKIIDFGYARYLYQKGKDFLKEGLNPFYLASEAFNYVFSVQSDLFSVGALYYHLLFGLPPWFVEISQYKSDSIKLEEVILKERKKPLRVMSSGLSIDDQTIQIINKALQTDVDVRFKSAKEFIQALHGELVVESPESTESSSPEKKKLGAREGFNAIAGMQKLKDTIRLDVIDALADKERYREYGLTIPNGMLLYGPPGCGKTFFAEKMAEEIGFPFYPIKPSDIQSKWVNASQENIKNLFDEARKNAPSIIFIDELDALVPSRDNSSVNHMNTSAVNEFLAQMNNSGEDGVFIIGATNRPKAIDPAILRAGRLDKTFYLPPPDLEARKLMFKHYLEKRPIEIGVNYLRLAQATEDYVSSDIKFLCDEAARKALKLKTRISEKILLDTIQHNKSSLSRTELIQYQKLQSQMDGTDPRDSGKPKIGF